MFRIRHLHPHFSFCQAKHLVKHTRCSATNVKSKSKSEEGLKRDGSSAVLFLKREGLVVDTSLISERKTSLDALSSHDLDRLRSVLRDSRVEDPGCSVFGGQWRRHLKGDGALKLPQSVLDWREMEVDWRNVPGYYMKLSKFRLSLLVVATTVTGYMMAPAAFDPVGFTLCAVGTGLVSASANSINQFFEVPFDAQMDRTKNRVIVKGLLTPSHAVAFAAASATTGLGILAFGVNGLTCCLGAFNLFLYTLIYTPMKRLTILNTWVGSIVGAVPPVMGWVGCTGSLDSGALLLGCLLFSWQFPHFNALSWNLRPDYARAGYRMMCITNPELCRRVALRHSVAILGISSLAPVVNATTWTFAVDSIPLNAWLVYLAWRFYKDGDSQSSRRLFRFSLLHLPLLMMLMLISKAPNR